MKLNERNEEMRAFFDEKADGYDAVHLPMMENKAAITRALTEPVERVLDLGAGTGLELIPLFDRFPGARVTVVDISREMLRQLEQRPFAGQVETLCGDFFALPFPDGMDAVISSAALHHFDSGEKAALYRKIYASLRPGGRFVNCDRCVDTLQQQEEGFALYHDPQRTQRHCDTPLCREEEIRLLKEAGFGQIAVTDREDGRYKLIACVKE